LDAAGIHNLRSTSEYTSATMSNNVSAPFSIAFKTEVSLLLRFLNIAMILCQDLIDIVATFTVVLRSKKTKLAERLAPGPNNKIGEQIVNIE
jgi:hypothetical protein